MKKTLHLPIYRIFIFTTFSIGDFIPNFQCCTGEITIFFVCWMVQEGTAWIGFSHSPRRLSCHGERVLNGLGDAENSRLMGDWQAQYLFYLFLKSWVSYFPTTWLIFEIHGIWEKTSSEPSFEKKSLCPVWNEMVLFSISSAPLLNFQRTCQHLKLQNFLRNCLSMWWCCVSWDLRMRTSQWAKRWSVEITPRATITMASEVTSLSSFGPL